MTAQQLAAKTGFPVLQVQRQLDRLVDLGVAAKISAGRSRRAPSFRSVGDSIAVAYGHDDSETVRAVMDIHSRNHDRHCEIIKELADPDPTSRRGTRIIFYSIEQLSAEELKELRRRILAVVELFQRPANRQRDAGPRSSETDRNSTAGLHTQGVSIVVQPLVRPVLPIPPIWLATEERLLNDRRMRKTNTRTAALSVREREAIDILASGKTRRFAAERMRLSINTINTLAARAFRKLGVRTQAELVAAIGNDASS